MLRAIYPGSFDPVTYGHIDIMRRSCKIVDELIVGVLSNKAKIPLFSVEERVKMLKEVTKDLDNIRIVPFDGLLVEFASRMNAGLVIRGLRAITDFEYELQMSQTNQKLDPNIETMFLTTSIEYSYLSSTTVRDYTILGLPFLLFGKPFYQKNHYTCSSYAAELLEKAGVCTWNKHFSLVTPKDFYEYKGKQKIFEGSLRELTEREKKTYPEYGTLTFPPISRPAYLSAAGNYITMAHVHNVREEERKGRRRRYER